MARAFGTGTKGIAGLRKELYPSTNTSSVYVLPFRREDDSSGVRRMIVVSRPMSLSLHGGWCESGTAQVLEAAFNSSAPGWDPPRRAVVHGHIALGAFALATLVCE